MGNMDGYSLHRNNLQTGDLLLFSGQGPISDIIKLFCNSKWSHVGLVVKSNDMDMLMIFESTTLSTIPDVEDNRIHRGVQCVELSRRVANYPGSISYRMLQGVVTPEMLGKLGEFRKEVQNRPYERHPLELINALVHVGGITSGPSDLSSLFCSELISESLKRMGILSDKVESEEYTPKDFRKGGMLDNYILNNFAYDAEIMIKE